MKTDLFLALARAAGFGNRSRNGFQPGHRSALNGNRPNDEPTLEQIAERAAEIRLEWDEGEERLRRTGTLRRVAWVVPGQR